MDKFWTFLKVFPKYVFICYFIIVFFGLLKVLLRGELSNMTFQTFIEGLLYISPLAIVGAVILYLKDR